MKEGLRVQQSGADLKPPQVAGQILTFHTRAWLSFAPPPCRMPLGLSQCIPQADSEERPPPRLMHRNIISEPNTKGPSRGGLSELPLAFLFRRPQNQGRDRRIRWS